MSDSTMDQVINILRKTNDGNDLAPIHLHLLQRMSGGIYVVTEAMEVALVDLHAAVIEGRYCRDTIYLQGVEHLTKDHEGYVYWKGTRVEHYSFPDATAERLAALELAKVCLDLESRKIPITGRTVLDRRFRDAPEGTPWFLLLQSLYWTFFENDELAWLLLSTKDGKGIAIRKTASGTERLVFEDEIGLGSYNGFHALQQRGFYSVPERVETYSGLINEVQRKGFTPEDIRQAFEPAA